MKRLDEFLLARSIQKHVRRLKTAGYSHPPILKDGTAYFDVMANDGRKHRVTVTKRTLEDELRDAKEWVASNQGRDHEIQH